MRKKEADTVETAAKRKFKFKPASYHIILFGFLAVIIMGTLLLMLPIATADGRGAGFLEALFTATSSTCVTGLVVQDTATFWSLFGKTVIIILIQTGGLGVVTMAVSFFMLTGKKVSLLQRAVMQDSISVSDFGGIKKLTLFLLRTTFAVEIIGALLIYPVFSKEFGWLRGIGFSIFHSISAFCNAGFDLMGEKEKFSSLTSFAGSPLINFTIMSLIIIGGLGFGVWDQIWKKRFRFKKFSLQAKLVLLTTLFLILIPAVYFFIFEFRSLPLGERFLASLFQSVTPRTAGFNTTNQTGLSDSGAMVTTILMLIGGSPGSTAGGMKTTTFAVLMAAAFSVFRHSKDTSMLKRRIPQKTLRNAIAIFLLYVSLFLAAAMIISYHERIDFLTCLYETASAIGTVGLTLGITPSLGTASRLILIGLMYFGRVGGLTLMFTATTFSKKESSKFPEEDVSVG